MLQRDCNTCSDLEVTFSALKLCLMLEKVSRALEWLVFQSFAVLSSDAVNSHELSWLIWDEFTALSCPSERKTKQDIKGTVVDKSKQRFSFHGTKSMNLGSRQSCKNPTNLQIWFRGRFWPKHEGSFVDSALIPFSWENGNQLMKNAMQNTGQLFFQ